MTKTFHFLKVLLFIFIFLNSIAIASDPAVEFYFLNKIANQDLYVRFYPVGAVFNGQDHPYPPTMYSLRARGVDPINPNSGFQRKGSEVKLKYIIGLDGYALSTFNHPNLDSLYFRVEPTTEFSYDKWMLIGHDATANPTEQDALFGYGKYMFEIYINTNLDSPFVKILQLPIDWLDFNYPYTSSMGGSIDLRLRIYSLDPLNITFQWLNPNGDEIPLFGSGSPPYNGGIQVYKQYHRIISGIWQGFNLNNQYPPSKGNSLSDSYYLNYPLDGRFSPSPYTIPQHLNSGLIKANVSVDTNVSTPLMLIESPTNISISNKALFKIEAADTFNIVTPTSPSNGYVNLFVEDTSTLIVRPTGKIIVSSPNKITLKNTGTIVINSGGEIRIKPGALFCNEGGKLFGRVTYEAGFHQPMCSQLADYLLQDSVKFVLDSNAVLPILSNTTLHFRGNTTSLIMKPGSKLLFGENSGIVCDSGAKLIANNATFASIDSTKKWNGISLRHLSQDTIKNCVIKNATSGISIYNKYSSSESAVPYSTEISGCTFVNQTNYVLNSGVSVVGSTNVLIMNNTFSSNALTKGFNNGIYAEYCPEGDFNIIGNSISNSGNGMTLISCSPFVTQNTLNGNEYAESGMFLDNVNGTFEYNVVNDFYYSYFSFYSSPDLLKNTFNNSYDVNIYLSTSSVPSMRPIVSGGTSFWFSGDNTTKGSPSDAGILFDEDAYPNMNYGYNRFPLTNNTYYINGVNPTGGSRYFDVFQNYWGGTPDSNKFYVYNADAVRYNPYDNDSPTPRATNNYTLYSIGFGLYDTVFFYEPDNPIMVQELYLEAYQREYSGEYSEAIEIYKEIVFDYKDSSYATSSLSRIFNCYEKKNSTISEYSSLQSYYSNIFNDTSYSETQRNLSEDFLIKSKVKQNNVEEAISDYNTIYMNNMNTAKGTHSLINKEILLTGSGDNLSGNGNLELRQNRINEILSNIIKKKSNVLSNISTQPESFTLSQNYPNPFNPTTTISFSIPTGNFVKLKVFDITGREIKVLINEYKQRGNYEVEFDGSNLSSGVYYYKLESSNNSEIKKMILIK